MKPSEKLSREEIIALVIKHYDSVTIHLTANPVYTPKEKRVAKSACFALKRRIFRDLYERDLLYEPGER